MDLESASFFVSGLHNERKEMGDEKPSVDECQRMDSVEEMPDAYDANECQDCSNGNCIFMPESEYRKFMDGETESMFPDGIDDGFNFSDAGGG